MCLKTLNTGKREIYVNDIQNKVEKKQNSKKNGTRKKVRSFKQMWIVVHRMHCDEKRNKIYLTKHNIGVLGITGTHIDKQNYSYGIEGYVVLPASKHNQVRFNKLSEDLARM